MANLRFEFDGLQAVVTGGAAGIGFATTKAFLESGAKVAVWDYSEEAMEIAKSELSSFAERVSFSKVDVANFESCTSAASALGSELNILVNNAGITRDKSFKKMDTETFQSVIETNLTGVFNVTKSLLDRFSADGAKRIVNIASVVALYGNFGQTNYVAAKSGVIGMTKTWARELAGKGFTSNAIAPGFIETAMIKAMPEAAIQTISAKVPVGRLGRPEDIANMVQYLSSDAGSYINGAVLSVDGGLVC